MIELLNIKASLESIRDYGAHDAYPDHPEIAEEIAQRAERTIAEIDKRIALTAPPPPTLPNT